MNKGQYKAGYCLEFAIALKEYYERKGKDVFLAGVLKYKLEDEQEEKNVFFKDGNIHQLNDFLEDIEVSHAFVAIKDKNGNFNFEDIDGVKNEKDLIENSLFSSTFKADGIRIISFSDQFEAESYLGDIEENILNQARKDILKLKNKKTLNLK